MKILNIPTNTTAIRDGARCSRAPPAWRSRWYHRWPMRSPRFRIALTYHGPIHHLCLAGGADLRDPVAQRGDGRPALPAEHSLHSRRPPPRPAARYATFLTRPDDMVCWNVVECCELIGILHDVGHRRPGDLILDMCAAPGGKTTHIAALANDRARIFALDKNVSKGALHSHRDFERENAFEC